MRYFCHPIPQVTNMKTKPKSRLLYLRDRLRFVFLFVFFFFSSTFVLSQTLPGTNHSNSSAVVTITGEAKIFSTDQAFNKQLESNKIVLENAVVTKKSSSNSGEITITNPNAQKTSLKQQVLKTAERKKREVQNRLKKAKAVQKKINTEKTANFRNNTETSHWAVSNTFKKEICSFERHIQPDSNTQINEYKTILIEHTHAVQILFSSVIFENYLLTAVFSVRPPPAIIS